jgi:RNA polymerase sigma-70 factor (ECF subfamily)
MSVPADTIDTLFRRESGRLIAVLMRLLGPQNLQLAEDVVQEAFVAAMRDWEVNGVPDNPPAWLLTAARRRAIDAIRRERTRRTFAAELATFLDSEWTLAHDRRRGLQDYGIRDDQLRMISCAVIATLSPENRVTLI